MKQSSGNKSIYAALVANLLIAITKFIAGGFTNSSSMISEGIHSTVDTTNQILLLYGLKRSRKPADRLRPFGYGRELYFWAFIVSILIFGLGGGLSVYQGIQHMLHETPLTDPTWNYVVLILSLIFETVSLVVAYKEFHRTREGLSIWQTIITSKDPASFLVLFEDAAAVGGLLIVFVFMFIAHQFNLPYLDGAGSICVGLLLIFVSFILARESRSLLMGEGIAPETRKKIRSLVEKDESVTRVKSILSTYQSPESVVMMLIVQFKPDLDTQDITDAIERIRTSVKGEFSLVQFVIIQPEA
ncbi:cation diffusion facilitator family transporter [soil metagenome]